jgi:hypothetical protein
MLGASENGEDSVEFAQALALVDEMHLDVCCTRPSARSPRTGAVEAVAAALLEREILSAMELYKIIVKAR